MLDFLSDTPGHLVAFRAAGRVDASDIERSLQHLDDALAQHGRVSAFGDLCDLEGVAWRALWADIQYGLNQRENLRRFYRLAVVTEQAWVRAVIRWEGRLLMPGAEVRVFAPAERDEALRWAGEPPPSGEPTRGFEPLETDQPRVLAYALRGPAVTGADVDAIGEALRDAYDTREDVGLLLRLDAPVRFGIDILTGDLLRLKRAALRDLARYAVVGGPAWLGGAFRLLSPLAGIEMRRFAGTDAGEAEARAWLSA